MFLCKMVLDSNCVHMFHIQIWQKELMNHSTMFVSRILNDLILPRLSDANAYATIESCASADYLVRRTVVRGFDLIIDIPIY